MKLADNGSEYVNSVVAALLTKLHIEFTKSRERHSNDNGLAERKNAAVVRKTFGKGYIDQKHADKINQFNRDVLNVYVNYHRPCYFPTVLVDEKGKQRKKYALCDMMTPYDKLKSLEGAQQYLKPGVTFKILDDIADAMFEYWNTLKRILIIPRGGPLWPPFFGQAWGPSPYDLVLSTCITLAFCRKKAFNTHYDTI